jgi:glycosyltransferase involved in cell wall biosynthesis
MLKVAVIGSRNMPANYGGVETACDHLYSHLANQNVKVVAYCRSDRFKFEKYYHNGVEVINFPVPEIPGIATFLHCFLAAVLASFSDADIIHFHAQGPALFSLIPRLLAPRKKIGFTCQGRDWQRDKWGKLARAVIRQGEVHSAHHTDFRIMVSDDLKAYYQLKYQVASTRLPNGVLIPKKVTLKHLSQRFGLVQDQYLLFIGRLVPEKAPDILIQAFNQLDTNLKLVIAGDSLETPDYVNSLKTLAAQNPNIIFTSYLRGRELAEVYSNALAYISPSKLEGNPITALEAMSYGLPLALSDIPPHEEILSFYQKPFVSSFKSNSVEDCKRALSALSRMPVGALKDIGMESRRVVQQHFSWDTIAEETRQIYMQAVYGSNVLHPEFSVNPGQSQIEQRDLAGSAR